MPAHVVSGAVVAVGVALVQLLSAALAGPHAASVAIVGAVCASLADLPNTLDRTWNRVLAAGLLGTLSATIVTLLRHEPAALAAAIAALTFTGAMGLSWGPRAGPISFAPVLALVFTMGLPPQAQASPAATAGHAMGGVLAYLGWSVLACAVLQPRYRRLALGEAVDATAHLLRTRAGMLRGATDDGTAAALRALVADEAMLAERLQLARDLLFPAPDTPRNRRETAALLHVIDLRDVLLASRLDLDRLGTDELARRLRGRVADGLDAMAEALEGFEAPPRDGPPQAKATAAAWTPERGFDDLAIDAADPRGRLVPALVDRLRHLHDDVTAIRALARGGEPRLALSRDALRAFVAPEGWPLSALRAQATLDSPVLRHAIRSALALGSAYLVAVALPWSAHPHWLVLGVAVVLRGSLDQTLARRNLRVLGTLIGCLLVLAFAKLQSPVLMSAIFLAATGIAHAFALRRYLVTAIAATLMALLQAHLADPAGGFAIGERLADTVLGAALAWAFSYVLPSWERRHLRPAIVRAMQALNEYAGRALSTDLGASVAQRLARRQAYDALGALGASLQRSASEPQRVRPPVEELAAFLDGGQRLMAHLSAVRLMLARRSAVLETPAAGEALRETRAALAALLTLRGDVEHAAPARAPARGLESLPMEPPGRDLLPWLERRLQVTIEEAREARGEARRALARLSQMQTTTKGEPR